MDIVYVILSMALSIVIVNVVLIQQNGLFSKSVIFIILSVLIYFLIKYVHNYNKDKTKEPIIEDLKKTEDKKDESDTKKDERDTKKDESDTTKEDSNDMKGERNTKKDERDTKKDESDNKKGDVVESFDANIERYSNIHAKEKIPTKFDEQPMLSNTKGVHPITSKSNGNSLQYSNVSSHSHNSISEEDDMVVGDGIVGEEDDMVAEENATVSEEDDMVAEASNTSGSYLTSQSVNKLKGGGLLSTKPRPNTSRDLPEHTHKSKVYKPYDTPININISYNTKSSTNTDDIISIKERFGKPDESSHIFHENEPLPETTNMKLNTNNQQQRHYTQSDQPKTTDSKRHGHVYNQSPQLKDNHVYSGHNYEYIHPSIGDHTTRNKKNEVCPITINQHWSAWNRQPLSGNNINENMII
jgi:hypothetical protein